jgi:hypothetical protein
MDEQWYCFHNVTRTSIIASCTTSIIAILVGCQTCFQHLKKLSFPSTLYSKNPTLFTKRSLNLIFHHSHKKQVHKNFDKEWERLEVKMVPTLYCKF